MTLPILVVLLAAMTLASPAESILFIGNSYTAANGGLGSHLAAFYSSAVPGDSIVVLELTAGGATLQNHWSNPTVISAISSGDWDIAVMQEQSTRPVRDPLLMYEFADSLGNLARSSGSIPALFMTWARMNDPAMIRDLDAAYSYAASLSDALVAPAGRAFQCSSVDSPEILLYEPDGSHPNAHGTYLAVCVLYAFIWEDSPVGVEYLSDPSITESEKLALQNTAWNTFLEFGAER